jgi:3-oxoacyl-[acyl-carrier protein] reductase
MLIKDKVIAITGGGRGLGRAMALAFAGKGGHVALLDLNQEDLDETRSTWKKSG